MIRPLPRGPHGLERDVVLASQRGRMLDAMAEWIARVIANSKQS